MNGEGRASALEWIGRLGPDGATNINAGLVAGESALSGAPGSRRLVLVSDGKATVGEVDRALAPEGAFASSSSS